jgi:Uma2 family endonuclease
MITQLSQLDLQNGHYSYADYLSWQIQEWIELIRGKIMVRMSAPSMGHQAISYNLLHFMSGYFWQKKCRVFHAPFDVRLEKNPQTAAEKSFTVVRPDLCVVCDLQKLDKLGCVGAPDWIIEIISPSSYQMDMVTKKELYRSANVREYWIVDPNNRIVWQCVLQENERYEEQIFSANETIISALFPDLSMPLSEVFLPEED